METKIYGKLTKFKEKEIEIKKDAKWFNYTYATLWTILDAITPALKDLKLLFTHRVENSEVKTKLVDIESWEFIESSIPIWLVESKRIEKYTDDKTKKNIETVESNSLDPQWVGAIITYYRRYNIVAILDLEIEDNDWIEWSAKGKNKVNYNQKKWEHDYECTKCWVVNEWADIREWQYWPYFKCTSCNWYSKPTKMIHEDDGKDLSVQDF